MKGYIVTLMNVPESVKVANRCIASAIKYGIDTEKVPAVWRTESMNELKKEGLKPTFGDERWAKPEAAFGNFVSQYRIWKKIRDSSMPGIVLEHDAVFIDQVPNLARKGEIINLGEPSYGSFRTKNKPGVYPMFSKVGGYIPGAHGYYITPKGAQELIRKAKDIGAVACDLFLHVKNFPNIKELYPWIIQAHDNFTTIQKESGCKAKHNYGKGKKFDII